jgi:hypothetical protein
LLLISLYAWNIIYSGGRSSGTSGSLLRRSYYVSGVKFLSTIFTTFNSTKNFLLTEAVQVVTAKTVGNLLRKCLDTFSPRTQLFSFLGKEIKTCFRLTPKYESKAVCILNTKQTSLKAGLFCVYLDVPRAGIETYSFSTPFGYFCSLPPEIAQKLFDSFDQTKKLPARKLTTF